jgi:hypothetical protein
MEIKEAIDKALNSNVDMTREEFAEKAAMADRATEAHGIGGEAPLTEEERERRMRMNYYGTVINVGMSILAALDDIADKLVTVNNNIVALGKLSEGGN